MNRPRYITTTLCAALNEAGAHYLVIGGIASARSYYDENAKLTVVFGS